MHEIGLSMIVKNEGSIIRSNLIRLCNKLPIGFIAISDTGSNDGTISEVKAFFNSVENSMECVLEQHQWSDFGTNRTKALEMCRGKCRYTLIFDADDSLIGSVELPDLKADGYYFPIRGSSVQYQRLLLVKTDLNWRFEGVVHEYITCDKNDKCLESFSNTGWFVHSGRYGSRSRDALKYQKDAALLRTEVKKNPNNTRNWFYLGQSYSNASMSTEAMWAYTVRSKMNGWDQELYVCNIRMFFENCKLGVPDHHISNIFHLKEAIRHDPSRAEAYYFLARVYRKQKLWAESFSMCKIGSKCQMSPDHLFVHRDIYSWKMDLEYAISCFFTHREKTALLMFQNLLENDDIPRNSKTKLKENINHIVSEILVPKEKTLMKKKRVGVDGDSVQEKETTSH